MERNTVGLIVIGDEILRGQIIDTNSSYLAKALRAAGFKLHRIVVVPDVVDKIAEEVCDMIKRCETVFTTGGVGPTHDDVTYNAIAKAFGLESSINIELLHFYQGVFPNKTNAANILACVPNPCQIIYITSEDSFPVIKVNNVYILPGSPNYFQPAVNNIISKEPIFSDGNVLGFEHIDVDADEFDIVELLSEQSKHWAKQVDIGSYPQLQPQKYTKITIEGPRNIVVEAKKCLDMALKNNKIPLFQTHFNIEEAQRIIINGQLEKHIKKSLDIIQQCYNKYKHDEIFLSFNGGKDGTVVLHLAMAIATVHKATPLLCLYVTGDTFPEVDEFVHDASNYYNLNLVKKDWPIKSAVVSLLNDKREIKASLMGVRRGDPHSENLQSFTMTDSGWPELVRVNPILDWTYEQVWNFLRNYNVPYCKLYDQGYTSIGAKTKTSPNPLLKDPKNPSSYLPAYTLSDDTAERGGRF